MNQNNEIKERKHKCKWKFRQYVAYGQLFISVVKIYECSCGKVGIKYIDTERILE